MAEEAEARDWLSRVAQGDEGALRRLYDAYSPAIYRFALARLGNAADAADVVNEVMLEVWRGAAARYQGDASVSTWLHGMTSFRIIDCLRRRARHEGGGNPEPGSDRQEYELWMEAEGEPPGEALVRAAEDATLLRRCLDRLGPLLRQAVYLAFFEERPYGEIAGILQCSEGTVKSRIFNARRQLRECLEGLMAGRV